MTTTDNVATTPVNGQGRSGLEAWTTLLKTKSSRWSEIADGLSEPLFLAAHAPKFKLTLGDTFFCIGSCFARNLEEHLMYHGVPVLSRRVVCPSGEWGGARINGFVNKFTTLSMMNELSWLLDPPTIDHRLFDETANGWLDLQLSVGLPTVSLERAIERRRYLLNEYFSRIRESSVIVLTLGLVEIWRDTLMERYLNAAPGFYSVRRDPDRYQFEILDVARNKDALEHIYAMLKQLQPNARIVITVSPVPLGETFSGKDVGVANNLSKAILRVAADGFAASHDDVDYFPSFDMIALSPRATAYGPDCLHVSDAAVGKVMSHFMSLYFDDAPVAAQFNELGYLAANPDVEAAVREGLFESGFEHWNAYGRTEGRPLMPSTGPTPRMSSVGH